MKTNQVLVRKMGEFEVLQRTEDGMFNATLLLKQWNLSSGQKKQMVHYFDNSATEEFINALMTEENFTKRNSVFIKSKAVRGDNVGTWISPLLFIDFAMWLNPTFKVQVLKFVYDELIKFRNDAGDSYIEMSYAVAKIITPKKEIPQSIAKVAQAINFIAFGNHEKGSRNKCDENSINEFVRVQRDATLLYIEFFLDVSPHTLKKVLKEESGTTLDSPDEVLKGDSITLSLMTGHVKNSQAITRYASVQFGTLKKLVEKVFE